jgi:hypothetical protein
MLSQSPRFRQDLVASATEADGIPWVDVRDPRTGTNFRLYDFEYQIALQLNGQPLEEVAAWAASTYGIDLTPDGVGEFVVRLGELGFLESAGAQRDGGGEASEVADGEWSNAQSVTAQFVPDRAILTEGQDRTPAIPESAIDELAIEDAPLPMSPAPPTDTQPMEADGSSSTAGGSGIVELPDDIITELPGSGPTAYVAAAAGGGAAPNGPLAPAQVGPPPPGMAERRQPPAPDAVVAVPVDADTGRQFRAPPPERARRSAAGLVIGILVLLAAAAGGGYYYWMRQHPREPQALKVRVLAPKPTAVYRWYSTAGAVVNQDVRTAAFEAPGRVAEIIAAGTTFAAGDTLGKLQGAASAEADVDRIKSRLAFYQQMRDSMKAAGNQPELRQAELKITEKQKLLEEAEAAFKREVLRAPEPGEVTEVMAKVGGSVSPKAAALKWKGHSLHGDFTMDEQDFATAGKLAFCRVEAQESGKLVDCKLPPPAESPPSGPGASPLRKFSVELPSNAGLTAGQPLRLARLRYDGVFPLPAGAVVHGEGGDKVWVISPQGTAQIRPVTIAETRDEALVSQGLTVGDQVITEPPADLQEGARVAAEQ